MAATAQTQAAQAALKSPTPDQAAAYAGALRIQSIRLAERGAGRSGYLSDEQESWARFYDQTVSEALDAGVGFDINAVEAA